MRETGCRSRVGTTTVRRLTGARCPAFSEMSSPRCPTTPCPIQRPARKALPGTRATPGDARFPPALESVVVHHDAIWGDSDDDTLVARPGRERLPGVLVRQFLDQLGPRVVGNRRPTADLGIAIRVGDVGD